MALYTFSWLLFLLPSYFKRIDIPDCVGTNMTMILRSFSVDYHNVLRSRTAKGLIPTVEHKPLPKAANMYKMDYSCPLELEANTLVNRCLTYQKSPTFKKNGWNFRDIDANTVTSPVEALREAILIWARTIILDSLPRSVAPSQKDESAMPFLQIATAESVQIGCSMKLCENSGSHNFYSIACFYGPPRVRLYVPIYHPGVPCNECRPGTKCIEKMKICAPQNFTERVNSQGK